MNDYRKGEGPFAEPVGWGAEPHGVVSSLQHPVRGIAPMRGMAPDTNLRSLAGQCRRTTGLLIGDVFCGTVQEREFWELCNSDLWCDSAPEIH